MKLTLNLLTAKGHYGQEMVASGSTVSEVLKKVVGLLDAMPDEEDGVKQMDWTKMSIEIER